MNNSIQENVSAITFADVKAAAASAGEIQDGRFACVGMKLFNLTSYDDFFVLTVYKADEYYNPSESHNMSEEDILEIYGSTDEELMKAELGYRIIEALSINLSI